MWGGYHFLDAANSGYTHISHNHHNGIFGTGLHWTTHIEAIWNIIKSKIKNMYYVIPNKHFLQFVREAEYRFKIRDKSQVEKVKDFFECYELILNVSDVEFPKNGFISDSDNLNENEVSDDDLEE